MIDYDDLHRPDPGEAAPETPSTVLVVEDDPALARVCVSRLAQLHMRAKVVATPGEAMDCLADSHEDYAVAFVDSGVAHGAADLAAEAHRLRPTLPIVVASDALEDVLTSEGVVLCKPFTADQFQAALDAALVRE
jgi:DNA-binding response OmpR family regulator